MEIDKSGRIHELVFTQSENAYLISDEYFKGEGVLMSITLIGKSPYDIGVEYSFKPGSGKILTK